MCTNFGVKVEFLIVGGCIDKIDLSANTVN